MPSWFKDLKDLKEFISTLKILCLKTFFTFFRKTSNVRERQVGCQLDTSDTYSYLFVAVHQHNRLMWSRQGRFTLSTSR